MRMGYGLVAGLVILPVIALSQAAAAAGNAEAGARQFQNCAACHALEPGRHMTGPSLGAIWGQPAGRAPGFIRYSKALKASGIVWDANALDAWLASPAGFVPDNAMTFPGMANTEARADLIAFLEAVATGTMAGPALPQGGMMGAPVLQSVKGLGPDQQVMAIRSCGDSYFVTTADGTVLPFWEYNLRFVTGATELGPPKGRPAIVPSGMLGDRALVIFATPSEISSLIQVRCEPGEVP